MKENATVTAALRAVEAQFAEMKETLLDLARIPGVSAAGFPPGEVRRSAEAFADLLRRTGLEHVEILEIPGVHPYVYADWIKRPDAPTLLLYGHHDVVPPGRLERWTSPPFAPLEREGRLYGRGTADDKGGILVHVAAVAAYLRTARALPCNVKFLIEGEEEIGSGNLGRFLDRYKKKMAADAVVLSDTSNFDTGVPGLTYRLRGLCQVDVEVSCLERPVHSGQKGGLVPDPVQILSRLIADLTAKDGSLAIPGLYRKVAKTAPRQRARLRRLPFDARRIGRQAGILPGVRLAGGERLLAIRNVVDTSVPDRHRVRSAPDRGLFEPDPGLGAGADLDAHGSDMDSREAGELLIRKLTKSPPHGARVKAHIVRSTPWWETDPEGPGLRGGAAGSEGGVRQGGRAHGGGRVHRLRPAVLEFLKDAPCLLTGVEDPECGAHSENESLHLGDWKKCMRAAVHLYDELSRLSSLR
jgi:acetylornithine deacetylase/succinyl-diaminopimelate desuccinylase-like protein